MDDRVDAVDGGRHRLRIADVAPEDPQPRVLGQWGGGAIEGADLVPAVEEFGYQVGADEAGASGDEHTAEIGGQR